MHRKTYDQLVKNCVYRSLFLVFINNGILFNFMGGRGVHEIYIYIYGRPTLFAYSRCH